MSSDGNDGSFGDFYNIDSQINEFWKKGKQNVDQYAAAGKGNYGGGGLVTLFNQITGDKNLDKESKAYLLRGISEASLNKQTAKDVTQKIQAEYKAAIEGVDPKFKSRIATQKYYETMFEQPGRQQTRGQDFSLLMSNNSVSGGGRR